MPPAARVVRFCFAKNEATLDAAGERLRRLGVMNPHLRVTLVQADIAWQDPAANRHRLAAHFRGLAGHTDLIVLPEMFSTGFSMDAEALAEPWTGRRSAGCARRPPRWAASITGSLIVARRRAATTTACVWARPDGTLAHYDKRHLFRMAGEHEHYAAGDRRLTVELKGWRVCPLVCYDLRFPVWSRSRGDYDLLLYVANWPARRAHAWSALLRARAIENLCYVVGVNRIGRDGNGASYAGDSVALDFLGQPLSSEGGGDRVETAVLDMESLRAYRASFPAHLDADGFELAMKKRTRVTHLPERERAARQPAAGRADLPVGQVHLRRRRPRRRSTSARKRDGFYYSRVSNPTLRQLELRARGAAGSRRLPAHRVGRRRDLDDAARAAARPAITSCTSRSRTSRRARFIRRTLGRFGVDEHDAVGHRPRVARADARERRRRGSWCSSARRTRC